MTIVTLGGYAQKVLLIGMYKKNVLEGAKGYWWNYI